MRSRMGIPTVFANFTLLAALLAPAPVAADHLEITRSFTGIWDQPDHDSQGLVLQISDTEDDEKLAVAYWFTYGDDLLSAWYLALGPVEGHEIPMTLYRASGAGFMEEDVEPDATVEEVGTLLLSFHNCNQGRAAFETPEELLGAGEFRIQRLTSIYRMRCSGTHADDGGGPLKLEVRLHPARDDVEGQGKGLYWERSTRIDFKVEVEGLADGSYALEVCGEHRGDFEVADGEGAIAFRDPPTDSHLPLGFDPLDCPIDVLDEVGVALTSGDAVLGEQDHGPGDDDDAGLVIEVELTDTGAIPGAKGEATYEMDGDGTEFSIMVKDVPAGLYGVHVDGVLVGQVEVVDDDGKTRGKLRFADPQGPDTGLLDFDPLGKTIEVLDGATVILEAVFPAA